MKKTYEELIREMQSNPIYQEIDKICKANDYVLKSACINCYWSVEIAIVPGVQERHFQPDIYYRWNHFEKAGKFEIGAWSLWSLEVSEFEKIIKGNMQALNVVNGVSSLDVKKLYQFPKEED